ncbi:MAG: metalloregulator ArsR/SmtB family transcription factor [Pseudomonadota bacterium]|nr:metalloregulator ArsR/SmtB family transcription factor [Pseudomonadota bacterium]
MNIESISQTFKALSDPIRLRIVYLLLEKESLCVCEVVETLDLSQSTVSRHLAYLKNSGLVRSWREGIWMHYALQKEILQIIKLSKLKLALEETAEISGDKQKLECDVKSCSIK